MQGWHDVPLSETGQAQARLLARRLAHVWENNQTARATNAGTSLLPGPPCAFYASDLSRAVDTARAIAEASAPLTKDEAVLPVTQMKNLRERHFGEREGYTEAEARAKWGDKASHHDIGETYAQVYLRMMDGLQTIWDSHASEGEGSVVLVAGHGGSLRLFLCRALGQGPNTARAFHLDNTSVSIVTLTGPTFDECWGRITLCNDTAHLQAFPPAD